MGLPKDPIKLVLWKKRQSEAQKGKKPSIETIEKRRITRMTGIHKANVVNCANCGKEIKRIFSRTKGRNYCNGKCQMEYEYTNGIRDPKTIMDKFHSIARKLIKEGTHPLLQKESRDTLRALMKTKEYREKQRLVHLGNKNGMYHKYGEENPNYKNGESNIRKLLWRRCEYKEWRKKIFGRDNYTCQLCGDNKGGNLNAHHIKSFKDYPELRFNIDNGVTLCEDCHIGIHKQLNLEKLIMVS